MPRVVLQVRIYCHALEAGHYLQSWQTEFYIVSAEADRVHACRVDTSSIVSWLAPEYRHFALLFTLMLCPSVL